VFIIYIYISDLHLSINSVSELILFPDDTSVIISSTHFRDFCSLSNLFLSHIIKWFAANNLGLNVDKTNILKFLTKSSSHSTLHIGYKENYIEETTYTKFLGFIN
jgi:hypothetical protein